MRPPARRPWPSTTPTRAAPCPPPASRSGGELGDGLFARAAAYAGFRPATLNELDRPFRLGADVTEANPALKPERLYGAEAGLGGTGARWSATVFYNRLQDAVINATVRQRPLHRSGRRLRAGTLFQRRNVDHIDAAGSRPKPSGASARPT